MNEQTFTLGELSRIERKPGDVFVIHSDRVLSCDAQQNIRKMWSEHIGTDCKLLIMHAGLRLEVISETEVTQ